MRNHPAKGQVGWGLTGETRKQKGSHVADTRDDEVANLMPEEQNVQLASEDGEFDQYVGFWGMFGEDGQRLIQSHARAGRKDGGKIGQPYVGMMGI